MVNLLPDHIPHQGPLPNRSNHHSSAEQAFSMSSLEKENSYRLQYESMFL